MSDPGTVYGDARLNIKVRFDIVCLKKEINKKSLNGFILLILSKKNKLFLTYFFLLIRMGATSI